VADRVDCKARVGFQTSPSSHGAADAQDQVAATATAAAAAAVDCSTIPFLLSVWVSWMASEWSARVCLIRPY